MKLPIVDTKPVQPREKPARTFKMTASYVVRVLLLVGIVMGLHRVARRYDTTRGPHFYQGNSLYFGKLPMIRTETSVIKIDHLKDGAFTFTATTSPEADEVTGYAGPNNVMMVLDQDRYILSIELLSSADTIEYIELVRRDKAFWSQFHSLRWGDAQVATLDGVSGATLTSLAIVEAVGLRMNGERISLRFPDGLFLNEAQSLCSEVASFEPIVHNGIRCWAAADAAGNELGTIFRSGNCTDSAPGYQGPTELLMLADTDQLVSHIALRKSYDNEPYVRYVRQERSFWTSFVGRTLDDLAQIDLEEEGIEGVSGATMTSMAVAETAKATAARIVDPTWRAPKHVKRWNWSWAEVLTAIIAILSILWSRSRFRGQFWARSVWQLVCFVVVGVATGNLLSMALFAGWTRGGIPFYLAPGLTTLLIVSIALPVFTGRNVYCDHICPHGAVQQWLRWFRLPAKYRSKPNKRSAASVFKTVLRLSALTIIAVAVGAILLGSTFPLAWCEPFGSYNWRMPFSVSIFICITSLLLCFWRPMAYCRLACPTGRILSFLRWSRQTKSGRTIDITLFIFAAGVWVQYLLGT